MKLPAALLALAASLPAGALERHEFEAPHMGTLARLVVYAPSRGAAEAGARAAFERIAELDARLSDYRDDSEVEALARDAGGPARRLGPDLFAVLGAAQRLARESAGAFDVTVGPLSRVWRAARRRNELPSAQQLEAALALVGHGGLLLDAATRSGRLERPGMRLDLGAIAKGYAADQALLALRQRGLTRALLTLGGEVAVGAPPPGRDGWTVAVATFPPHPQPPPLLLRDAAVSTSGDAEQWLEVAGERYSHVIDPRNGQALTGRRSVTVVARAGAEADGLATALSVLGVERGLALVERRDAAAFVVMQTATGLRIASSTRWAELARATR